VEESGWKRVAGREWLCCKTGWDAPCPILHLEPLVFFSWQRTHHAPHTYSQCADYLDGHCGQIPRLDTTKGAVEFVSLCDAQLQVRGPVHNYIKLMHVEFSRVPAKLAHAGAACL
jgi:hypothetical protein